MEELTDLYRQLARQFHPDSAPPDKRSFYTMIMQQINDAYNRRDVATLRTAAQASGVLGGSGRDPYQQAMTDAHNIFHPPSQPSYAPANYGYQPRSMPRMPDPPPMSNNIATRIETGTRAGLHTELAPPTITVYVSGTVGHLLALSDLDLANTPDFLEYAKCVAGALSFIRGSITIEQCLQWYRGVLANIESNGRGNGYPSYRY